MQAARLHAYTDDMGDALSIDEVDPTDVVPHAGIAADRAVERTVAEWLEHGEIEGRAVVKP
jgi:hypothetical protein